MLGADGFTNHCLRHTFRLNAQNALANLMVTMIIAGWSNEKINKVAVDYGAQGFSHSESLKVLQQEQSKIFRPLLKAEHELTKGGTNVVVFTGDKTK